MYGEFSIGIKYLFSLAKTEEQKRNNKKKIKLNLLIKSSFL